MAVDLRLSDDEAQEIVGAAEWCREDGRLDSAGFPCALLARAGATVLRMLRRQALELERERARSNRDEVSRVQGGTARRWRRRRRAAAALSARGTRPLRRSHVPADIQWVDGGTVRALGELSDVLVQHSGRG
jgi:hypothetical protein